MAGTLIFLTLAAVIYKANSQLCGCNGPGQVIQGQVQGANTCFVPNKPLNPGIPRPQPYIGPQTVVTPAVISSPNSPNPVTATTIIDNSVSNSLANALQLLIVSNLIENTINAGVLPRALAPVCDAVFNPAPCSPVDYVNVSPNMIGQCVCEGPVIETVVPNVCGYGDIGSIPGYALTDVMAPMQQTFGPICGGITPTIYNGVEGIATMAPVAAEVLFPSSIPAQLTCNFGYMSANVPCVSVNVEPLSSFDACCNPTLYNNGYFY